MDKDVIAKTQGTGDPQLRLAAERTLLAWIRTGLAIMGFGFVVARFGLFLREVSSFGHQLAPKHPGFSNWIGMALVTLGVVMNVLAGLEHLRVVKRIEQALPYIGPKISWGPIYAFGLALIGVAIMVYLTELIR